MLDFIDGMARWAGYGALLGIAAYLVFMVIVVFGALLLAQAQR